MGPEITPAQVEQRVSAVYDAFNPSHLNLILFATEQCNFRCTYCYEDFEIGRMSSEVVGGVKALLAARVPSLTSLVVSWFGGEPLLAPDVIRTVSHHIKSLSHPALDYRANVTTNGYLLSRERFEELLECGVRLFQISLDGYADVHDRTRRRADGCATFERIWNNLRGIRDTRHQGFVVLVRIHFFPDNRTELTDLAEKLNGEFAGDRRFQFYFKDIGKLGGPNDAQFATYDHDQCASAKMELDRLIRDTDQVYTLGAGQPYVCYAAQANSIAIRADGTLAKCTVALKDDRNNLGHITGDGRLRVDMDKWRLWLAGFSRGEQDWAELSCPYDRMPRRDPQPRTHLVRASSVARRTRSG